MSRFDRTAIMRRITGLLARARVILSDDSPRIQRLQIEVLKGEVREVERIQDYGFSSVPPDGAGPAILGAPSGDRAQAVVLRADDRRHRPTGAAKGTVVVYDNAGNAVRLEASALTVTGAVEINIDAGTDVNITAGGDVSVVAAGAANIQAATALIDSPSVDLGGSGGPAVARVGDLVNVIGGSSAGTHSIISGSAKVRAS